jgi:hypothetical protein
MTRVAHEGGGAALIGGQGDLPADRKCDVRGRPLDSPLKGAICSRRWLPLVEAFRTLLTSPDFEMLALPDDRGIAFDFH